MSGGDRTAAITGAYGYLGSLVRARLREEGWQTLALVRTPLPDDALAERFELAGGTSAETLRSVHVLIHCAYDLTLVRREDIHRVNVDGSRHLFRTAKEAGVRSIINVSSMSAYPGTTQIYGRAKLAIEAAVEELGGCSVRPGLVYGRHARGTAGALRNLTRLPVVPVITGRCHLVHEADFTTAMSAVAMAVTNGMGPISIAHATPVPIRALVEWLARSEDRSCRFVSVPWRVLYGVLRVGEMMRLRMPFRADSLLGLVRPPDSVVGIDALKRLGVDVRPFKLIGTESP
jgi:nucleoside-diphosphate-sugar epimerase